MLSLEEQNFTIIVNFKSRGFGCRKVCSYCNWRHSPLLPHGLQDMKELEKFIRTCKKSFVTISGGAEPLYRIDENYESFKQLSDLIRKCGYKVRLITREVGSLQKVRDLVDFVSISLDPEVLQDIHVHDLSGLNISWSLVLPPLSTENIVENIFPRYRQLLTRIPGKVAMRENLNSLYPLDFKQLRAAAPGPNVDFVEKRLCLGSRYFSVRDTTGYELMQDEEAVFKFLSDTPTAYIFGGAVKHVIFPEVHTDFTDWDVAFTSYESIRELQREFDLEIKEVSEKEDSYPRYFQLKSKERAGREVQAILFTCEEDVKRFVFNAQYDIDRLYINRRSIFCDPKRNRDTVLKSVRGRIATRINEERDTDLFTPKRHFVEMAHRNKLKNRGFTINE